MMNNYRQVINQNYPLVAPPRIPRSELDIAEIKRKLNLVQQIDWFDQDIESHIIKITRLNRKFLIKRNSKHERNALIVVQTCYDTHLKIRFSNYNVFRTYIDSISQNIFSIDDIINYVKTHPETIFSNPTDIQMYISLR